MPDRSIRYLQSAAAGKPYPAGTGFYYQFCEVQRQPQNHGAEPGPQLPYGPQPAR